jgi:hypothetical protein
MILTSAFAPTSRLVAEKTTIPIPRIYAYSLAREKGPYGIASFLILEYIEGKRLCEFGLINLFGDQRQRLYSQLANIYVQLRRLEFSSIGVLSRSLDKFEVRKKPISIDINVQELEGLQPSRIQAEYGGGNGVVTSAHDYISMLVRIARNAFERSRTSVLNKDDGQLALYHLDQFCQYAEKEWPKPELDHGPFVLVHGDLNPYNLIVTENMDVLALLDWEWARIVPLQFFNPPEWLTGRTPSLLAIPFVYSKYVTELNKFRTAIKDRELALYGKELLSKDWARVDENESILVAAALENWTDIHYFATRFLDWLLHKRKNLEGRIQKFMQEDSARGDLVARKVCDRIAYQAELEQLATKSHASNETKEDVKSVASREGTWNVVPSITQHLFSRPSAKDEAIF